MRTVSATSTRPTMSIRTTKTQLNIKAKTRGFTIQDKPTRMKLDHQLPQMKVNWKEVWAQMGLRSPDKLRSYIQSKNTQDLHEYVRKTANQGDFVADVGNYYNTGSDPFAQLAVQNMKEAIPEVNIANMPQTSPEVEWTRGTMELNWEKGTFELDWDKEFMPEYSATPYAVDINIQGRAKVSVSINETNAKYASGLGRNVDLGV